MKELNQEEWKTEAAQDEGAQILDVRTTEEFEEGYIPTAKLIDIRQPQQFMDELNKLDKSKPYYVYCRSGSRSAQACQIMNQLGFEHTYNLAGGFMKWEGEKNTSD